MRRADARAIGAIVATCAAFAAACVLAFAACDNLDATLVPVESGVDAPSDANADAADAGPQCPQPKPPEGVYTYSTGQSIPAIENLTIAGTTTQIKVGPIFNGSVRYTSAGYVFRLALSNDHNSALDMSLAPTGVQVGGWTELVYGNTSITTCAPPVAWFLCTPTTAQQAIACTGQNSMIDGGYNIVGTHTLSGNDSVVVGGMPIPAFHYVDHRSVEGTTTGTQDLEWWLRTTDGLPLRNIITTSVTSPSPLGPVLYTVNLDFTLQSLTPTALPVDASAL
jgi:hypothetical protein